MRPLVAVNGPLDLRATLYSGQAFRWTVQTDGSHFGFISNQPSRVQMDGHLLSVKGTDVSENAIRNYFRLDNTHEAFLQEVRRDPALEKALTRFAGLRLLRQDPWEMLVSFVISQNSNESKIRGSIEALCQLAGEATTFEGRVVHRFPTPAAVAGLTTAALRRTGMGYRAPYVRAVARAVEAGRLDPHALRALPYAEAFEALIVLDGVGPKVADCVLLYGCDHTSAFPSDVWVRRFVRETYLRRDKNPSHEKIHAFAQRHFGPFAGYAQHYLFHYRRAVGALADNRS